MTRAQRLRAQLRERSEYYLRMAAIRDLGSGVPGTVAPYRTGGGLFWRFVFVPVYRRLPWAVKRRAMERLRMTARGWTPPDRRPGEPWRWTGGT